MYVIEIIVPQCDAQWKKELLLRFVLNRCGRGVMENITETKMKKNKKTKVKMK